MNSRRRASSYSTYYEGGIDDRINVFVPKHEGMICQIDFSSFDIYYNTYTGTEHAYVKVYSGSGTTGDLLWESTKETKATVRKRYCALQPMTVASRWYSTPAAPTTTATRALPLR